MVEGARLGRYELIRPLGEGGMGEVFLARQEGPAGFSKMVVVKRVIRRLVADPAIVEMFLDEARIAAQLTHPNIVQIFDLGSDGEQYWIAMEYAHGRSLAETLRALRERRQTPPPALVAWLCAQALRGLHYAHELRDLSGRPLQIVHRDVSPENVLVTFNGGVKLVDFGIAKARWQEQTQVGVKGKYPYMSPEQRRGERVDFRADLYGIGVLLHELLTGSPTESGAGTLVFLREVARRALDRDREGRFSSAGEMADALDGFVRASGQVLGPSQVAIWMEGLFGAEASRGAAEADPDRTSIGADTPLVTHPLPLTPPRPSDDDRLPTPIVEGTVVETPGVAQTQPGQPSPVGRSGSKKAPAPDATAWDAKPALVVQFGGAAQAPFSDATRQDMRLVAALSAEREGRAAHPPLSAPPAAAEPAPRPAPVPVRSLLAPEVADAVARLSRERPVPGAEPPLAIRERVSPGPTTPARPRKVIWAGVAGAVALAGLGLGFATLRNHPVPWLGTSAAEDEAQQKPKAVARPARPAAARREEGWLDLRPSPPAQAWVDGKSLGTTPLRVPLEAGAHVLTLRNAALKVEREVVINIPVGATFVSRQNLLGPP